MVWNDNFLTPETEIQSRIKKLKGLMAPLGIEGALIVHRPDLYYLTGTAQRAYLFVPLEGEPVLFVRSFIERAKKESPLKNIVEIGSTRDLPNLVKQHTGYQISSLGLELDVMPYNDYLFYKGLFGDPMILDISPCILKAREVKSPWEIERLREVARLSFMTFEYMRDSIRPGLTETEFAGQFEAFARKYGHAGKLRVRDWLTEGYTFHILSGPATGMVGLLDSPMSGIGTSPAFPCGASLREMGPNEPIMIDLNLMLNGYHFDETRMFCMGKIPSEAKKLSLAAIEILEEVVGLARPGLPIASLYERAWQVAKRLGVEEEFLGLPKYKTKYIGHGIGIELVEPPIISGNTDNILEEGMVFALEPKLVSSKGFGAGVEAVFYITETGADLLSETPCQIFEVDIRA